MADPERKLSEMEQQELFKLLAFKTLLNTKVEDWRKQPNEFVSLAIPEKLLKFTETFSNKQQVLEGIIADLVVRGIASVAKDMKDPNNIDSMIHNIFHQGVKEQ